MPRRWANQPARASAAASAATTTRTGSATRRAGHLGAKGFASEHDRQAGTGRKRLKPCLGRRAVVQRPHPTSWRWSYVAFRFGDGASHALIALAVVLHYDLPIWVLAVTTACMNLVGVPATFLWGTVID